MAEIFTYTDYRKFIKDHCEDIRKEKPFFSYRYIAQKAELKSTGFISWVVSGKRTISLKLAHKICTIFKLGKRETDYFLLLVNHNQSTSGTERQHYLDRMLAFRSTRTEIVHRDQDQYYSKWYYAAIRELVAIHGSPFVCVTDEARTFAFGTIPRGNYTLSIRPKEQRLFIAHANYDFSINEIAEQARLDVVVP